MTEEEQAAHIIALIDGAVVGYTLESGEAWNKGKYVVRIPEEMFKTLRRYHEWERRSVLPSDGHSHRLEQEVDLPKYRVRNGGPGSEIRIMFLSGGGFNFGDTLKEVYLDGVKDMLNSSSILLKKMEKK